MTARRLGLATIVALVAACDGLWVNIPELPDIPVVEDIKFSTTSAAIFFRETMAITANPRGKLDVDVAADVTWHAEDPGIIEILPTSSDAHSATLQPMGIGTTTVHATAGNVTKAMTVTVLDTAFSVSLAPGLPPLIVGDTVTLRATVDGPPGVSPLVRWTKPAGSQVIFETSVDADSVRVQVTGVNASVRAHARADSTKSVLTPMVVSSAMLAFVTTPGASVKGQAIPAVQVAVRNESGQPSLRSRTEVSVSLLADAGCPGQLLGAQARAVIAGVANFPDLAVDRRGAACRLTASAVPTAASAESMPFDVGPRDCSPVPLPIGGTIVGFVGATDCQVNRGGATHYAHVYSVTMTTGSRLIHVTTQGLAAQRLESDVWAPSGEVRVDTATGTSNPARTYGFGPGTHTLTITSRLPGTTGAYVAEADTSGTRGCSLFVTRGAALGNGVASRGGLFGFNSGCIVQLQNGPQQGRSYIVWLPAGQTVTASMQPFGGGNFDGHVEAYDITSGGATFIGKHTGAGQNLPPGNIVPGSYTVASGPTGRWIEFRMAMMNPIGPNSSQVVTIQ